MTLRLYRTDPCLRQFTARVVERLEVNGRPALVLDQTAFYPTAGGQANDLGALNGAAVVDVIERDDGEIVHLLAQPVPDDAVAGEIDWTRRFDHMQQHSGQHVLSQAFVQAAGLDTVSVHLGSGDNTLDLPAARLDAAAIERAEDLANAVVFQDLPVTAREVTDAELPSIPLRKPPKVTGLIRIVEVQGFDWSACGGTHVASAGQIGLIRVLKAERRADTTRVYFICGRRALIDYRQVSAVVDSLAESFRAGRAELGQAVERLRNEAEAARKQLADAQEQLVEYEARDLLACAVPIAGGRLVAQAYADRTAGQLKWMAKRLAAEPGVVALLGAAGGKSALCFARAAGAPGDMGALLRGAAGQLGPGAKGGGSADFAQGGGPPADAAQVQAALDWARSRFM